MPEPPDRLFGFVAVQLGFLAPARLDEALRAFERECPPRSLSDWLCAHGFLTAVQAAEVARAHVAALGPAAAPAHAAPAKSAAPAGPTPPAPGAADAFVPRRTTPDAVTLVGPAPDAAHAAAPAAAIGTPSGVPASAFSSTDAHVAPPPPNPAVAPTSTPATARETLTIVGPPPSEANAASSPTRVAAAPGLPPHPEASRALASRAAAYSGSSTGSAAPVAPGDATRLGKYELIEEVGRGGMGVVYRAFDTELRREVALKTLHLGDVRDPQQADRLLREARTAASLDHPGIVPVHDVGVVDGVPYLAMAFLRGRTLDRLIRDRALRDSREKARIACEIARAVGHAHAHRIIHRDIKPSNVLLDAEGHIHVMDFGLAKSLDDGGPALKPAP